MLPLLLGNIFALLFCKINFIMPLKQQSASNFSTTWIWTALNGRLVTRQHHRFLLLNAIFKVERSMSSASWGCYLLKASRSSGNSFITGAMTCDLHFLLVTDLFLIDRAFLMRRIHIVCRTMFHAANTLMLFNPDDILKTHLIERVGTKLIPLLMIMLDKTSDMKNLTRHKLPMRRILLNPVKRHRPCLKDQNPRPGLACVQWWLVFLLSI